MFMVNIDTCCVAQACESLALANWRGLDDEGDLPIQMVCEMELHSRHMVLIRDVTFRLQSGHSDLLANGPNVVMMVDMSVFCGNGSRRMCATPSFHPSRMSCRRHGKQPPWSSGGGMIIRFNDSTLPAWRRPSRSK